MRRFLDFLFLASVLSLSSCSSGEIDEIVDWADPFIGTGYRIGDHGKILGKGKTHPGATTPFGIQSVTLNGEPYDRCYIDYKDIVAGGVIELTMGPEPAVDAFDKRTGEDIIQGRMGS